jgi:hypothetical protein
MKTNARSTWLLALSFIMLLGCAPSDWEKERRNKFITEYGSLEFAFPPGWKKQTNENPFDLQCLSPNEEMNCGIFVYTDKDLSADISPQSVLTTHLEDIRGKRQDFKELSEPRSVTIDDKVITVIPCTGKKDDELFSYVFVRVDFKNDPKVFAILLHVALPELQRKAEDNVLRIARSARTLPPAATSP